MKFLSIYILLTLTLSWIQLWTVFALSNDTDYTYKIKVSETTLSEAKLLKSYVTQYKININSLYSRFKEDETETMLRANQQLFSMIQRLQTIENSQLSDSEANIEMKKIVSELKKLNTHLRSYLEDVQIAHSLYLKVQKNRYLQYIQKISKLLDWLIEWLSTPLLHKTSLSPSEREVVQSLIRIQEQNKKLKQFSQNNFLSQEDMKQFLQDIINNIRNEIKRIKTIQ